MIETRLETAERKAVKRLFSLVPNQFITCFRWRGRLLLVLALLSILLVAQIIYPWSLGDLVRRYIFRPNHFSEGVYWALVTVASLFFFGSAMIVNVTGSGQHQRIIALIRERWAFGLSICLVVFAWRWPTLASYELNPDESQSIAGAITLLHDPRYWVSVDGTTHGPLTDYVLLVPTYIFGLAQDYATARITAIGFALGSVFGVLAIFRLFFTEGICRILILPLGFTVACFNYREYIAYFGEHITVFLIVLSCYLSLKSLSVPSNLSLRTCFTVGLILGSIPYAKMQGIPAGVAIGLMYLWALIGRTRTSRSRFCGALIGGAVLPTFLVFGYVFLMNVSEYYWKSYIAWNIWYTGRHQLTELEKFSPFMKWIWECRLHDYFISYLVLSIILGLCGLLVARIAWGFNGNSRILLYAGILLFASVYAVYKPGNPFPHYLLFVFFPLALLNGALWGTIIQGISTRKAYTLAICSFLLISLLKPMYREFRYADNALAVYGIRDKIGDLILQYADENDCLFVWGWAPHLYVVTGIRQATRNALTYREIVDGSLRPYFRQVLLADFDNNQPAVFIDAVGPGAFGFSDRPTYGYETLPELQTRVAKNYDFIADTGVVRIFVRKDRMQAVRSRQWKAQESNQNT